MKTIQKILFSTFLLGACSFASCKKFLEEKSNTALVVPTTIEDLQALLDKAENMNTGTPMYGEAGSDDQFVTDEIYGYQYFYDQDAYIWKQFDYQYPNDWSNGYHPVYVSNLCLETLEKISIDSQNEGKWKNVKGSALFYRAYNFLNLVWTFSKAYDPSTSGSDLGIPLRQNSDFNKQYLRANVEDTYKQIIADALAATDLLPDHPQHVMRPSKAAAYGLLARTYLSMRKYNDALKYANLALSIKNTLLDFNNPANVDLASPLPFAPFNEETIFYTTISSNFLALPFNFISLVDTNLYASYDPDDLRSAAYFEPSGDYQIFTGNYNQEGIMFTGIATDEMYLTRAECYARVGNKTEALNDLNHLLEKRWRSGTFVPVNTGTAQDALAVILKERRKELLCRGLRWIDIKRLNKEGANIVPKRVLGGQTYTLPVNSNMYALPLPKDIVDQGIAQNPQ